MSREKQIPDIDAIDQELPEGIQAANQEVKPPTTFFPKFRHDWSPILARALAYNLLTAMFSIGLVLLSVPGIVLRRLDPHMQDELITHLQDIFPRAIASGDAISTFFHQLSTVSDVLGIIVIVLAIFTVSRLFILIERCFNIIYRLHSRSFFARNFIAIGMALLFIVLTPIMILTSSLPALVPALVKNSPLGHVPGISLLFSLAGVLSSLIVASILFQAIYMVIPNRRITFSKSWPGTLVAAGALQMYLAFFPLYATHFLGGYVGQAGFAIILLAFFYYFGVILLLGAEVNAFFSEDIRTRIGDLATLVYSAANKEEANQQEEASRRKAH